MLVLDGCASDRIFEFSLGSRYVVSVAIGTTVVGWTVGLVDSNEFLGTVCVDGGVVPGTPVSEFGGLQVASARSMIGIIMINLEFRMGRWVCLNINRIS